MGQYSSIPFDRNLAHLDLSLFGYKDLQSWFGNQFIELPIYSGTIYAMVSLVFWVYYSALIFIIGGEVAQAHELRRVRRRQKETLG